MHIYNYNRKAVSKRSDGSFVSAVISHYIYHIQIR